MNYDERKKKQEEERKREDDSLNDLIDEVVDAACAAVDAIDFSD